MIRLVALALAAASWSAPGAQAQIVQPAGSAATQIGATVCLPLASGSVAIIGAGTVSFQSTCGGAVFLTTASGIVLTTPSGVRLTK